MSLSSTNSREPSQPASIRTHEEYIGKDLKAMSFAQNYHNWIIDEFRPYIKGQVAEIGAGSGNLSSLLLRTAYDNLYAFEPSPNMYALLAKRFESHPEIKTFNAYLGDEAANFQESFDTIIYNNVMEHVEDDVAELALNFQTLKPGGHMLFLVPALQWLYSEFDKDLGHFRRYHKAPAIKLFKDAGFKIVSAKYLDLPGIIPWYVLFRLLKKKLTPGKVSLYDKLAIPVIRFIESIVAPPIGKNILIIAKKPH